MTKATAAMVCAIAALAIGCSTTQVARYEKKIAKITEAAGEVCRDYGGLVELQAAVVVAVDKAAAPIEASVVTAAQKACGAIDLFRTIDQRSNSPR